MKKSLSRPLSVFLFAAIGASWVAAQEAPAPQPLVTFKGQVLGTDGQPVFDAELAFDWTKRMPSDWWEPAGQGFFTDKQGKFTFSTRTTRYPLTVTVFDRQRRHGATFVVNKEDSTKDLKITLEPLVAVTVNVDLPEEKGQRVDLRLVIISKKFQRIGMIEHAAPHQTLLLPAGDYTLGISDIGYRLNVLGAPFSAPRGAVAVDAPVMKPTLTPLGLTLQNEPPAWTVTDARGISKDVKISDYKGKWVLIDLWGYWCHWCVVEALPGLMKIYDEYPDQRDKFQIFAFHHDTAGKVKNISDMEAMNADNVKNLWKGRDLPFPVLLDSTGKTMKDWDIHAWPTLIIINPQGKVDSVRVGAGSEEYLIKLMGLHK